MRYLALSFVFFVSFVSCKETAEAPPAATTTTMVTSTSLPKPAQAAKLDFDPAKCQAHSFKNRGKAPMSFIKGMAWAYAKAVCKPNETVLTNRSNNDEKDALSWYNSNFKALGMSNELSSIDTMRHVYTLLIGLGMRESSGKYCCGRDASASNISSESAEAGVFQTSYDSKSADPQLVSLYKNPTKACLLEIFSQGVTCSDSNFKNWGVGADGLGFQEKSKKCPAFAAEYAAIMLRKSGGTKGHYGPLRRKEAEIVPACDDMLKQVEKSVMKDRSICDILL